MSAQDSILAAPPEALDTDPALSTLMTHQLTGIVPDAQPWVAWQVMDQSAIRHLPVLDGTRCLVWCSNPIWCAALPSGRCSASTMPR